MKQFSVSVFVLLQLIFFASAQYVFPPSTTYTCYGGDEDCTTATVSDTTGDSAEDNPCCVSGGTIASTGSFRVGDGGCRACSHDSVQHPEGQLNLCYADTACETRQNDNSFDLDNTLANSCCNGGSSTLAYRVGTEATECIPCIDDSEVVVGNDPHFFLPLSNEDNLCFSVQGEPDFGFNLVKDKNVNLNAQFVLPAADESITVANVSTFLGSLGLVVKNPVTGIETTVEVSAVHHSVLVGGSLTIIEDKAVRVNISRSKVTTSVDEHVQLTRLHDESAWLYIDSDAGFGIKVRFYKKHLDMFLTKTSGLTNQAHGLIGQFLGSDVKVDYENNLISFGDRKPIAVEKGTAWKFLGIAEECWYGIATDNQGTGVIDGTYTDYVVEHLIKPTTQEQ